MTSSNSQIALLLLVDASADAAREIGQMSLDAEAAARSPRARVRRFVGMVCDCASAFRSRSSARTVRQREAIIRLSTPAAATAGFGYACQFLAIVRVWSVWRSESLIPPAVLMSLLAALIYLSYRTRMRGLLPLTGRRSRRRGATAPADSRRAGFGYLQFLAVVFFVSAGLTDSSLWRPVLFPILFLAGAAISYLANLILVDSMWERGLLPNWRH